LLLISVTVHVTVVVPTGKLAGASLVTVATAQLSLAIGVPNVTPVASQELASGLMFKSAGHIIDGSVTSTTVVIVSLAVAVQPKLSNIVTS